MKMRRTIRTSKSGLSAKFTRPQVGSIYERTILFKLLDRARKRPVIWIVSPAGSGKTTLVASYLKARKTPTLWYQMDAGDADPASFFYCMGQGAQALLPNKKPILPLLTPEYSAALPVFTANYFQSLFGRMKPGSVIVFDNYQDAANPDSPLHDLLARGFDQIPKGMNAIVVSREEPPPAYAHYRANERLSRIDWDALRLTERETIEIAKRRDRNIHLSPATLKALHQETQGWVAGIVLLTERVKTNELEPAIQCPGATQPVFDYFAAEIFRRGDATMREFLLKTAFLPQVSPVLAEMLTGEALSETILKDLARRNFFTLRHDSGTYEYHPLFRAFLQNCANDVFSLDELNNIKRTSADLLVKSGDIDSAISLLREAGAGHRMLALILDHARQFAEQGRTQTIQTWLDALPDDVAADPWVFYWKGICDMTVSPLTARRYFEQAFAAFGGGGDASPLYLSWVGIIESMVLASDDFSQMRQWLDRYPSLCDKRSPPSPEIETKSIFAYVSGMVHSCFDHPDLPKYAQKAESLLSETDNLGQRFANATILFLYSVWKGDCAKAQSIIDSLAPYVATPDMNPVSWIYWHYCKMIRANLNGSLDESNRIADEALKLAQTTGVHALDFHFHAWAIWKYLAPGNSDIASARAELQKMVRFSGRSKLMEASYHLRAATIFQHEGNFVRGIEEGLRALKLCQETNYFIETVIARAALSQLYAEQGNFEVASMHSDEVRSFAARMKSPFFEVVYCFLRANILRMQGRRALALEALRNALVTEQAMGFVMVPAPWYSSEHIAALYEMALEEGICADYVRAVIEKIQLPSPSGCLSDRWPWEVRIYTFGGFAVFVDDVPLTFSGKTQRKPIELLHALVLSGRNGAMRDKLAQMLWPDAEGDTAKVSLDTTVHRLRKLLGEQSIQTHDDRLSLNPAHCWLDVWAFERLSDSIESSVSPSVQITRLLGLYRGPFLDGYDTPPALVQRQRLQSKFMRAIGQLGRAIESEANPQVVIDLYVKGLEVDPLAEELYRRLMRYLYELGRSGEALALYHRCYAVFTSVLDVEPSLQTKRLFEEIQQGQI